MDIDVQREDHSTIPASTLKDITGILRADKDTTKKDKSVSNERRVVLKEGFRKTREYYLEISHSAYEHDDDRWTLAFFPTDNLREGQFYDFSLQSGKIRDSQMCVVNAKTIALISKLVSAAATQVKGQPITEHEIPPTVSQAGIIKRVRRLLLGGD